MTVLTDPATESITIVLMVQSSVISPMPVLLLVLVKRFRLFVKLRPHISVITVKKFGILIWVSLFRNVYSFSVTLTF